MTDPLLEISTPVPPKAVEALKRMPGVSEAAMFGRKVHAVVPGEKGGTDAIRRQLETEGVPFTSVKPVSPSLEDVFVALIQEEGGAVEG